MNEAMEEGAEGKFFIRSGDDGFKSRQNGVFDQLSMLEDKHSVAVSTWKNDPVLKFEDVDEEVENCNFDVKPDFGGSSKVANAELFKVPIGVPPKRLARPSGTPDYSVHPEKWTKYTLSDVTQESLSEDANSEAAMDFLKSRWKAGNDYQEPNSELADEPSASTTKLEFGKFLMPEYQVGKSGPKSSSQAKRRKDDDTAAPKATNVKLSFLNSICPSKHEDPELDPGEEVENKVPLAEEDEPIKFHGRKPASPEPNELFRAIRKRRRNIRQASLSVDEEAGDN